MAKSCSTSAMAMANLLLPLLALCLALFCPAHSAVHTCPEDSNALNLLFATLLTSWGSCQKRTGLGTVHTFTGSLPVPLSSTTFNAFFCVYLSYVLRVSDRTACHVSRMSERMQRNSGIENADAVPCVVWMVWGIIVVGLFRKDMKRRNSSFRRI